MNWTAFWKSLIVQLIAVGLLFVVLAVLLPKSFFESWGWLSGPAAWMLCALVTASVLRYPKTEVLVGAALAGLPAIVFVVLGLHTIASPVAALFFGFWCGYRIPYGQPSH